MNRSPCLVISPLLTFAGSAIGQQLHINHTLSFVEVVAGTNTPVASPDGFIEPGEAARLQISVSFTPLVGQALPYTPPPPPGIGVVAGLLGMTSYLQGLNGAQGNWSLLARAPGWSTLGSPGSPTPDGSGIDYIAAGQFVTLGQTANSQNPIDEIWRGVWRPLSYAPRTVLWREYRFFQESDGVLIQYGLSPEGYPLYTGLFNGFTSAGLSQVNIPIIPAPASLVALSALFLQRRGRGP